MAILAAGPYPGRNRAGNAVFLLPEKRAVVVMTTTNFSERQSHAFTRTLLTRELISPLQECQPAFAADMPAFACLTAALVRNSSELSSLRSNVESA